LRTFGVTLIALLLSAGTPRPAVRSYFSTSAAVTRGAECRATGAPRDSLAVIALTEDGTRIVVLGSTSGELLHSFPLGAVRHPAPPTQYPAGSIVLDERTCEVIVAEIDSAHGTTGVLALSLRDWQLRNVATLADTTGFPWVDVGGSTGRLYLMGRQGIEVVVLDRQSGRVGREVYRARVSPGERRVYLSYHGGLDWVDLAQRKLCVDAPTLRWHGGLGCQESVHGDFNFFGSDVVAATGGPEVVLVDSSGAVRKTRPMNLVNRYAVSDHFMWLSVDTRRGIAYGTMMCILGHGIMSISIADTATTESTRNFADNACGEHISPVADGSALIVLNYLVGQLTIIDLKSGSITQTIGSDRAGVHIVDVIGVAVEHPHLDR
jgi:DNA-binding beta-propeller fold protein YncE